MSELLTVAHHIRDVKDSGHSYWPWGMCMAASRRVLVGCLAALLWPETEDVTCPGVCRGLGYVLFDVVAWRPSTCGHCGGRGVVSVPRRRVVA